MCAAFLILSSLFKIIFDSLTSSDLSFCECVLLRLTCRVRGIAQSSFLDASVTSICCCAECTGYRRPIMYAVWPLELLFFSLHFYGFCWRRA